MKTYLEKHNRGIYYWAQNAILYSIRMLLFYLNCNNILISCNKGIFFIYGESNVLIHLRFVVVTFTVFDLSNKTGAQSY